MNKAAANKTTTTKTTGSGSKKQPSLDGWTIALQFLDTSWRVAMPIAGLSYIGIVLDRRLDSRPIYSLIGFFFSLFVAIVLVYKQIRRAYPDFTIKGGGR